MTASPKKLWLVPLWRGLLLALEIAGAGIILCWSVPFYRELLAGNFNQVKPAVKLWMVFAIVLIQAGYWLRYSHRVTPILPKRTILGHLAVFSARLNFIFASGLYSAVFFTQYDRVIFSVGGTVLLFSILFSMFCVTLDLERIGAAYLKGHGDASGTNPPSA